MSQLQKIQLVFACFYETVSTRGRGGFNPSHKYSRWKWKGTVIFCQIAWRKITARAKRSLRLLMCSHKLNKCNLLKTIGLTSSLKALIDISPDVFSHAEGNGGRLRPRWTISECLMKGYTLHNFRRYIIYKWPFSTETYHKLNFSYKIYIYSLQAISS